MKIPDIIIAIDGCSSTGKSTFAKLAASRFAFLYLDSGAMYRGVTLAGMEKGIVKEETLREFRAIIDRLKQEDGIEAVILGCTELPLLLNSDNCGLPCLDSVDIHIRKLIEAAMS